MIVERELEKMMAWNDGRERVRGDGWF